MRRLWRGSECKFETNVEVKNIIDGAQVNGLTLALTSSQIEDGTIATYDIVAGAVTNAKINTVAASKVSAGKFGIGDLIFQLQVRLIFY